MSTPLQTALPPDILIEQARLLARRLERLSADSIWARRSSGCRGSLIKWLEAFESQPAALTQTDLAQLKEMMAAGFFMLESAAREYPE